MSRLSRLCLVPVVFILTITSAAQSRRAAAPASMAPGAFSGTITLAVDASDAARKIFHARLTVPASAGELTLVYPKWIPGEHGPTGPITDLAGLRFTANGQTLAWVRDDVDMYAVHMNVPAGATSVEASLDYLSPAEASGFSSGASASDKMTVISWNQVLLYPANTNSDNVTFKASLKLPAGWKFGTALPIASQSGETIDFQPAPLTTLVDSPVIAGEFYRAVDVTPPGEAIHHEVDIAADSAAALQATPQTIQAWKQLIAETGVLYGARHYRDYHFLLSLSDHVAHFGLEHHESSDDRVGERMLIDENPRKLNGSLLSHEMTHSWNGKYRRPAGLATPNYQEPMKGELLWVYEGLTEYLGDILAARSGLWSAEQYRSNLADVAGYLNDARPGRTWRPLQDTATAAQLLYSASFAWSSWRRGVDYYDEGELIWLDVDTTIRQLSGGKKSIDDFTHIFHGPPSGNPMVKPYTFEDVVNALNQVQPNDWAKFLRDRLDSLSPHAPLGGIVNGGWKLVYDDKPGEMFSAAEQEGKYVNANFSVGFSVGENGDIADVIIGGLAYKAGIGPGMKVVAVNGRKYSSDVFSDALIAGKNSSTSLDLLIENGEYFQTYRVDYHGGPRYPHLVRDESKPDVLAEIIKMHAAAVQ